MVFMGRSDAAVVGSGDAGNAGDAQTRMAGLLGDMSVSRLFYLSHKRVVYGDDQHLGGVQDMQVYVPRSFFHLRGRCQGVFQEIAQDHGQIRGPDGEVHWGSFGSGSEKRCPAAWRLRGSGR